MFFWLKIIFLLLPRMIFWNIKIRRIIKLKKKNIEKYNRVWPIERRWNLTNKYTKTIVKFFGMKFVVNGKENIPSVGGAVIIANHQSNADPIMMFSAIDRPAKFIAKKQIEKFYMIGNGANLVDTSWLDRGNQQQTAAVFMETIRAVRKEGRIMVIYPEGTRSKSEQMLEFKQDAIEMAKMTKAPIIPTRFTGAWKVLNKEYKLKGKEVVKLEFLEPISYEDYSKMTTTELTNYLKQKIGG